MMDTGHLVFDGIAPHPPIMVPEVGGAHAVDVYISIEAMRELTARIKACGVETVVLVSPHAPLERSSFVAYGGARLRGDFANFHAPQAIVEATADEELLAAIRQAAGKRGTASSRSGRMSVVVTDRSGSRCGLLLPEIEIIETADRRVGVAAKKAGIKRGEPLRLSAFAHAALASGRELLISERGGRQCQISTKPKALSGRRTRITSSSPTRRPTRLRT